MQFLLVAHDGADPDAPMRRQKARDAHLANLGRLKAAGHYVTGGALLDNRDAAIGSALILDFPDRAAFDAYLKSDPYMIGNVWQHLDINVFRPAPV